MRLTRPEAGLYLHGVASDRLLASYRTERFAAVSGVLHATDHDTGLIAGLVPKNHIDAVYFPEFCNRHYYRHQLPLQYAGFAAPQSAHPNGLMGHHVPWYVFTSPQARFRNSYDAFASGKVVVFPRASTVSLIPPETRRLVYILRP